MRTEYAFVGVWGEAPVLAIGRLDIILLDDTSA